MKNSTVMNYLVTKITLTMEHVVSVLYITDTIDQVKWKRASSSLFDANVFS